MSNPDKNEEEPGSQHDQMTISADKSVVPYGEDVVLTLSRQHCFKAGSFITVSLPTLLSTILADVGKFEEITSGNYSLSQTDEKTFKLTINEFSEKDVGRWGVAYGDEYSYLTLSGRKTPRYFKTAGSTGSSIAIEWYNNFSSDCQGYYIAHRMKDTDGLWDEKFITTKEVQTKTSGRYEYTIKYLFNETCYELKICSVDITGVKGQYTEPQVQSTRQVVCCCYCCIICQWCCCTMFGNIFGQHKRASDKEERSDNKEENMIETNPSVPTSDKEERRSNKVGNLIVTNHPVPSNPRNLKNSETEDIHEEEKKEPVIIQESTSSDQHNPTQSNDKPGESNVTSRPKGPDVKKL